MAEFPSMSIFVSDALEETAYLSPQAVGAYFSLFLATWNSAECSLPDDDRKLMVRARCDAATWAEVRDEVLALWPVGSDGQRRHAGLTKAREFAIKNRKARQEGAAKAREKRTGGKQPLADESEPDHPIDQQIDDQTDDQVAQQVLSSSSSSSLSESSENKNADPAPPPPRVGGEEGEMQKGAWKTYPSDFEGFWKDYWKNRTDSKAAACKIWHTLSAERKARAIASTPEWEKHCFAHSRTIPMNAHKYLREEIYERFQPKPKPMAAATESISPPPNVVGPLGVLEREEYEQFITEALSLTRRQRNVVGYMRDSALVELCKRLKADPESAAACRDDIDNYKR